MCPLSHPPTELLYALSFGRTLRILRTDIEVPIVVDEYHRLRPGPHRRSPRHIDEKELRVLFDLINAVLLAVAIVLAVPSALFAAECLLATRRRRPPAG